MGESFKRHTIPHDGPDLTKPANHGGDLLAPLLPAGEPVEQLLRKAQFFVPGGTPSSDLREVHRKGGRRAEEFYHERWRHDKVVRSTHGVNCTGSCSWKVYVKDGIITWETQQTDYPSTGPDSPEYEPRGCPRGASFCWYTYSPSRVRCPYVRGPLLELWREARARLGDPVDAWAEITGDPDKAARYKKARGQGGFVRAAWPEVTELIAAAHVHTVKAYGPDRVVGFSPIPAMSQVSYAAGTRFLSLIGGTILSFYDWYADLPPASPQVFGDQTDVPESGDWWNAAYLIIWGTNLPITRTPDAHFMTEARYRGQKVVVVSPDYSDHTKFADDWLAAAPGTDGALATAMGHVILAEFFRDRQVPYFTGYVKTYTDAPFLVTLEQREDAYVPGRFLTAADLGDDGEGAAHKTVLLNAGTGEPFAPNGSLGFRFTESGLGRWNKGRSMIAMGAGTNHWYHSDEIYRTFLTMIMLCGCQGVNGGGWAHYVGQEKVRPLTGWSTLAFALDWQRPARQMTGTSFFYLHTDQWRYESFGAAELASPLGRGLFAGRAFADCLAQASRLGWTPSYPTFGRNPLDLCDEAERAGVPVPGYVIRELAEGRLRFAGEDPDAPENWPRVMRPSWPCPVPPTGRSRCRPGVSWRNAPAYRSPTWPRSGRGSGSPSPIFAAIEALRVPAEYLANLFTAGDPGPVRRVLRTLAAVRTQMRAQQLGLDVPAGLASSVGAKEGDLADLYRLLAIAKYDERYVVPPAHTEDAGRLMAQHEQLFCSQPGGPDSFHPSATPQFRDGDGRLHLNLSPRGQS